MAEVLGRRSFVGRVTELERLASLLAAARGPSGRVVVLGGEAGVGKTRLAEQLVASPAAAGVIVLNGGCPKVSGGGLPYAPFVEILRRMVRTTPPERQPALLGPARADLARLLPELAGTASPVPATALDRSSLDRSSLDRTSQARLFELVAGILDRLAGTAPVLLVIEDVHWADESTRDLLAYLASAIRDRPVLLVLTIRTEALQAAPAVVDLLAELEREPHVERIELGSLDREDVAALLAAILDGPAPVDLVDRIHARSDGNPFYVEELALATRAAPGEALPPVLHDVLAAHLARLSRPARELILAAGVAGRSIDDDLISQALGVRPLELGPYLREAYDAGILIRTRTGGETTWMFRHELLREAVEESVPAAERTALHLALARALEARAASGGSVPAGQLADRWDLAGRPDRALAPMIQAGLDAERACAFGDALRRWDRVHSLATASGTPSVELPAGVDLAWVLERGAESAVLAGEYGRAVDLGRAALDAVDARLDPGRAGHLLERLRWFLWEAGDRSAAAQAVDAALDLIPREPPSPALARALGQRAGIALMARRYAAAVTDATEAVAVADRVGAAAEAALALGVLGWATAVLGEVDRGLGHVRAGIAIAERLESVEGVALGISSLVSLMDRVGRHAEGAVAAAEGFARVEGLGVARTYGALLLGFAARSLISLGRIDDADQATARGLSLRPAGRSELWLLVGRARVMTLRGRFGEASSLLGAADAVDARLRATEFRIPLLGAHMELALWSGRPGIAREIGGRVRAMGSEPGPPDPTLAWLAALALRAEADLAELARAARDVPALDRAIELGDAIAAEVSRVAAIERDNLLIAGPRSDALVAQLAEEAARARAADRSEGWAAISERWDAIDRPVSAAYARYRAAAAALRDREPRESAAGLLRQAHVVASELGVEPLRALAEGLARDARIDLGQEALGGPAMRELHLTEREIEVLRLVAGGWTNQQIADRLFITRKTASVHVSNILAKFGVSSRGEAAAIAHRLGHGADAPLPPGGP